MTGTNDRRQYDHWVKDFIIPLTIAVIVGVASAFVTVRVSVAVIETEMGYIREDVVDLKLVLQVVQNNQLAKTKLEIVSTDNAAEIDRIWTEINSIKTTRYTREDANRDIEMLRLEAKARHGEYNE